MKFRYSRLSAAALAIAGLFAWSAGAEAQPRRYCNKPAISAGPVQSYGAAFPGRGCPRGAAFRSNRPGNETTLCLYCAKGSLVFLADVYGGTYAACVQCEPGCSVILEGSLPGMGATIMAKCVR